MRLPEENEEIKLLKDKNKDESLNDNSEKEDNKYELNYKRKNRV